ncbi:MAG: hypothetical protein AABX38_05725 [Candidatus Micrarchaeota archaeon]
MASALVAIGNEIQQNKKLNFDQRARKNEIATLKKMYDASWANPKLAISEDQLKAKIVRFPEGQIVGRLENGTPVSMINVMQSVYDPKVGFVGGYNQVTGYRTFSTHLPSDAIDELKWNTPKLLPIALCVSIVVDPTHQGKDYALQTLNYAIEFARRNELIAVPYSRPSKFREAREQNPNLDMKTYLHLTRPTKGLGHTTHLRNLEEASRTGHRTRQALTGFAWTPSEQEYLRYALMMDNYNTSLEQTAFAQFVRELSTKFEANENYARRPTIEDFCILFRRKLIDPVMNMHVQNGARFIRDQKGEIIAIFENSRPEDTDALGHNIILSYDYRFEFGHSFMANVR